MVSCTVTSHKMDSFETNKEIETVESRSENFERKAGTKEILCDGYFYDVTDFVKKHPGGYVINYYTQNGEDATHAIQQFHQRSIKRVRAMMSSFKKRPASDSEIGLDKAVLEKNRALTKDFTKLYLDFEKEGLFEPSYTHNILRLSEVFIMAAVGYALLSWQSNFVKFAGIFIIGLARGRAGWIQHECGHNSFTGNPKFDRFVHAFIMGVPLGLSSMWWVRQHNRHHAMPQRLHHDVDLETTPFVAFNAKVVKNSKEGKGIMIQNQAYLFVVLDTLLLGYYWVFYLHPRFVFKRKYYLQMVALVLHWAIVYHVGFWTALLSNWILSMYLFGNFTLNHTHLPVTTEPTHWVEYSLLHTADIEQRPWCDWWMGYLNYQIEHHLFPTMPQFRHPLIKDRVKALAEKHNIPYIVLSYREAVWKTLTNLNDVARQVKHV